MKLFRNNRAQSYSQASPSRPILNGNGPDLNRSLPPTETPDTSFSAFRISAPGSSAGVVDSPTTETISSTQNRDSTGLPGYAPRPPALAVPSYHDAQSRSSVEGAVLMRESISSPTGQRIVHDYFSATPNGRQDEALEEGEEDADDPLVPRTLRPPPPSSLQPLPVRRATLAALPLHNPPPPEVPNGITTFSQLPIELPPPPANALPAYNAHLAHDELRLISSVHLDQNHPAAAFFSAMTSSVNRGGGSSSEGAQTEEMTTGGKKLKVTITRGGRRLNENGTGPIFVRLGRGGTVEGRIDVGKVDYATALEVSILGLVNTSYYVRGQYTLIDTMPLARTRQILYPPEFTEASAAATDAAPEAALFGSASTSAAGTIPSSSRVAIVPGATTITPNEVWGTDPSPTSGNGKEPMVFINHGQSFDFSLTVPAHHYRDEDVELPPSCQVFQVGIQAGVEYILRVKLSRKGWRLNEQLTVPIIYEPRAYLPPRRLRALTTNDALNPGWRTIRLTGGGPLKTTTNPEPGVEVTLLLPSPPILFVPHETIPPPIPFHLHFHSPLTLPLSTFSDPKQCTFVVRLMRVTMIRISTEREVRRMEMKSRTEIWQEGGSHILLGEDQRMENGTTQNGRMLSSTPVSAPGPARRPSTSNNERRRSFSDRRPSFLRRRSSVEQSSSGPSEADSSTPQNGILPTPSVPPISEEPSSPPAEESVLTPLSLDATDVHLLGQLTLFPPSGGPMMTIRSLVQSFSTPEISISYVLEVGLQPKKGAVREAFSHVWGGGLIEVVLGMR